MLVFIIKLCIDMLLEVLRVNFDSHRNLGVNISQGQSKFPASKFTTTLRCASFIFIRWYLTSLCYLQLSYCIFFNCRYCSITFFLSCSNMFLRARDIEFCFTLKPSRLLLFDFPCSFLTQLEPPGLCVERTFF